MKIARIETFLFDPGTAKNLLFCRVETESGMHGWGEAYVTPGKEPVIEHLLRDLGEIHDRPRCASASATPLKWCSKISRCAAHRLI